MSAKKLQFRETIVFTSGFLKGREHTATTITPRPVGFKSDCPQGTSQYEVVKVEPINHNQP